MTNKEFNSLKYVDFEFNSPDFEAPSLHDMSVSDALGEHTMDSISNSLLEAARLMAEHDFDGNVEARKAEGPGLPIEILVDGESLGCAHVDVNVLDEYKDMDLPNGDKVADMKDYGWSKFEQLEQIAQKQLEDDFAAGLDGISEPENGLGK